MKPPAFLSGICSEPMRILIENGVPNLHNLGDLAMLQVAIKRLQYLWPHASIQVLTARPDLLSKYCPEVTPISARGRDLWIRRSQHLLGRVHHYLPAVASRPLGRFADEVVRRWPDFVEQVTRLKMRCNGESSPEMLGFLEALKQADLVVLSGGGDFNDEFESSALTEVALLEMAIQRGAATAILGQGIGPFGSHTSALGEKLRAVLPVVDWICLRERLLGPSVLGTLGLDASRFAVTGDDAVELAYSTSASPYAKGIGVNLRVATYSGFAEDDIPTIRSVLQDAAQRYHAPLVPVPISLSECPSDMETIIRLLPDEPDRPWQEQVVDTPKDVIRRVAQCRLVVTGSYHGAVFALSQGIPAIGLARSDYYMSKFVGLADQFGTGCTVVRADGHEWPASLVQAINRVWASAEEVRLPLIRAAADQIRLGYAAYERLYELVEARLRRRAAHGRNLPVSHNGTPRT